MSRFRNDLKFHDTYRNLAEAVPVSSPPVLGWPMGPEGVIRADPFPALQGMRRRLKPSPYFTPPIKMQGIRRKRRKAD